MGVPVEEYIRWERGFSPSIERTHGEAVARALGVDLGWIVNGDASAAPPLSGAPQGTLAKELARLDYLGRRLEDRRNELGWSRAVLAAASGTTVHTLQRWERRLPQDRLVELEKRLEDALKVPPGWLRDQRIRAKPIAQRVVEPFACPDAKTVQEEIVAVATWLSRNDPESRTVAFEELNTSEKRNAVVFAERYRAAGGLRESAASQGASFEITPTRLHQIVRKMIDRAKGEAIRLTCLEALKVAIDVSGAVEASVVAERCREILGPDLDLASALAFAGEVIGMEVPGIAEAKFPTRNSTRQVIGSAQAAFVENVRSSARKMIRLYGVGHVLVLTGLLTKEMGIATSAAHVREALGAIEGIDWLQEESDWFWLGHEVPGNRALESAGKILAFAAGPVAISAVQHGIDRLRAGSSGDDLPPLDVPEAILGAALSRVPWLIVDSDRKVGIKNHKVADSSLTDAERAIGRTIRQCAGAVSIRDLEKCFVEPGFLTRANVLDVINRSPIIRRIEGGIYGLVGLDFSPDAISRVKAERREARLAKPAALDAEGWAWGVIAISKFRLEKGIFDLPAQIARVAPPGLYHLVGWGGATFTFGMTPSAGKRILGLLPVLELLRCKPGDTIEVAIHPELMFGHVRKLTKKEAATRKGADQKVAPDRIVHDISLY